MLNIAEKQDGMPIAAIGDVHGKFEMLSALLDALEAEGERIGGIRIVTLGDYIDRGNQSRQVIDRLLAGPRIAGNEFVHLRGNHDEMLLEAWADPDGAAMSRWCMCGGIQTLQSYGLDDEDQLLHGRWKAFVPAEHIAFLSSLHDALVDDARIYVHAGIVPGVPLRDQDARNLIWIREAFLQSDMNHGRVVVHGHTPTQYPTVRHNRINLDTGAYMSGTMTAAIFADGMKLLQSVQLRRIDAPLVVPLHMDTTEFAPSEFGL